MLSHERYPFTLSVPRGQVLHPLAKPLSGAAILSEYRNNQPLGQQKNRHKDEDKKYPKLIAQYVHGSASEFRIIE
jgi:hypothetical protein